MKRVRSPLLIACSSLLVAAPVAAQITSDRPGIGSGSAVLESGVIQLETGLSIAGGASTDQISIGQVLVRVGFSALELEVFGNSFAIQRSDVAPGLDAEGLQDAGLGVKLPQLRGASDRLDVSIQGILSAPTGATAFTADEWLGALNALADLSLADRLGVGVNLGIAQGAAGADDVVSVIVTPGVSLDGGFGLYGGWAGFLTDAGDTHFAEAGITFLPNPDLQLDLNGGWTPDGDDWFLGGGVALRWGAR